MQDGPLLRIVLDRLSAFGGQTTVRVVGVGGGPVGLDRVLGGRSPVVEGGAGLAGHVADSVVGEALAGGD